jgi:hypothetical protein
MKSEDKEIEKSEKRHVFKVDRSNIFCSTEAPSSSKQMNAKYLNGVSSLPNL